MSRFPDFLHRKFEDAGKSKKVFSLLQEKGLHTVCSSAKCPNIYECFAKGTATFLILGNICTRSCRFCGINKGKPSDINPDEPENLASVIKDLNIKYVVITSVTRDDLYDGGALHYKNCINEIRKNDDKIKIEILIPDFLGNTNSLKTALSSCPDILNHNIETIPRLYKMLRPEADYERSLSLLENSFMINPEIPTKSGLMVGLGEHEEEVLMVMKDLIKVKCSILTIGQYLKPTENSYPVQELIKPEQYTKYKEQGIKMGFKKVFAGPYVRSSYMAESIYQ